MKRNERRKQKKTARKKDTHTGDPARQSTGRRPSTEDTEAAKPNPYRDEGGES